jgi:hypothetical protein
MDHGGRGALARLVEAGLRDRLRHEVERERQAAVEIAIELGLEPGRLNAARAKQV